MMAEYVVFGASAFMAQVLTNLDNLAALLGLVLVSGPNRAVAGFLLAQVVVIAAAALLALGVDDVIPHWAGYLGFVPLGLGLLGVARQFRPNGDGARFQISSSAPVLVTMLLFVSLSMDTFAVLAPLLADSAPAFRVAGLVGAGMAALGLAMLGLLGGRFSAQTDGLARRIEKLVPFVMICAGVYILSNSWTDAI